MALCGSLYRMASDVTLDAIVTYATRLRREVGRIAGRRLRAPRARAPAFARLHPLGGRQDPVMQAPKRKLAAAPDVPVWTLR